MAQRYRLAQLLFPAISILASLAVAIQLFAQTSAPTRILACESTNDSCKRPDAPLDLVWAFNGIDGTATSPANPAGSHITIENSIATQSSFVASTKPGPLPASLPFTPAQSTARI